MENEGKVEEFKKVTKKALSPASTVLLTITATLGTIVLARAIYFIITGN